jgi:hypothetical protein
VAGAADSAAPRPPPRSKNITLTASAKIGAVMTLEMTDATTVAPFPIGVAITPRTIPARDHDQEDDHKRPEDRPGIAAHQTPAAPEGVDRPRPLHDDGGSAHRPQRQQDEAGDDHKGETDGDADREQDPEDDQGADRGGGRGEEVTDDPIAPAIADVLHQPDHESGVERDPYQPDDPGEDPENHSAGVPKETRGHADDAENHDRTSD